MRHPFRRVKGSRASRGNRNRTRPLLPRQDGPLCQRGFLLSPGLHRRRFPSQIKSSRPPRSPHRLRSVLSQSGDIIRLRSEKLLLPETRCCRSPRTNAFPAIRLRAVITISSYSLRRRLLAPLQPQFGPRGLTGASVSLRTFVLALSVCAICCNHNVKLLNEALFHIHTKPSRTKNGSSIISADL